jgi:hypothetical protein
MVIMPTTDYKRLNIELEYEIPEWALDVWENEKSLNLNVLDATEFPIKDVDYYSEDWQDVEDGVVSQLIAEFLGWTK